jgi:lysophospholipase L1-like esterase
MEIKKTPLAVTFHCFAGDAISLLMESPIMPLPKKFLFLCLALIESVAMSSKANPAPAPLAAVQRIVFLGDSITQAGDYVTDIECWLLSQGQQIEVIDVGLASETATDLLPEENASHLKKFGFPRPSISARLDRALAATKPDLVVACYGMNDGSGLPNTDAGLKRFSEAITRLRDTALKAGAKQVVLCTPPIHDSAHTPDPHEQNLVAFSQWLVSKRADGWTVVDIHSPMRRELDEIRKTNPSFQFQPDGVHPDRQGHWVMAREILTQFLGANLGNATSAESFFQSNGPTIRSLVDQRRLILFSAYMGQIGHARPGVPGGPGQKPAPSLSEATAQAAQITEKISPLVK